MAWEERLHRVIESLYESALDDERWPETLSRLMELTGSHSAAFSPEGDSHAQNEMRVGRRCRAHGRVHQWGEGRKLAG
jgi:hypothetical protein